MERALRDRAGPIRFQALIAFDRLARERAEPTLIAATEDEDAKVRYIALRIIEERCFQGERDIHAVPVGGEVPRALPELARSKLSDPAPEVQLAAAILLARAKDEAGHSVLVRAVNEGFGAREPEDEYAAVEFAGSLPEQQEIPDDGNPETAEAARCRATPDRPTYAPALRFATATQQADPRPRRRARGKPVRADRAGRAAAASRRGSFDSRTGDPGARRRATRELR